MGTTRMVTKKKRAPRQEPTEATPTQVETLIRVDKLRLKLGRTPTQAEIAEALGYADRTGPRKPMRALAKLGLVVYTARVVESHWELTPAGRKLIDRAK